MNYPRGSAPIKTAPASAQDTTGGKANAAKPYTGPDEHQLQTALFNKIAAHKNHIKALEMAFAVPNGFFIPGAPRVGGRVKKRFMDEGLSPGVPDLFLMVPRQGFSALAIEMKTPVGVLSKEQRVWRDNLIDYGYRWELCKGPDEAWNVIMDYLGVTK